MKVQVLKEKFLNGIGIWLEERVDDMLRDNPSLAISSVYIKRGCHNVINKYKDKIGNSIDNASLFIADGEGNINTDTLFADVMEIFKGMEESSFDIGFVKGVIGKGKISVTLPDNILMNVIFGSKKTITFNEDDFLELKSLLFTE